MTARTTRVEVRQEGDQLVAREVPLDAEEQVEADAIHEHTDAARAMVARRAEERERAASAAPAPTTRPRESAPVELGDQLSLLEASS